MLTARELKAFLREHRVHLSARLGQHHLIDANVIERFADLCELSRHDTVVEIGAGLGALTEALARRAGRVIAVEVDRRISALLADRLGGLKNVEVVCQDILEFPWQSWESVVVVGAIPYSITSPIFVSLCEQRARIRQALLLMQREVAQRLLAGPGTKAYGRLSLLGQYCWRASRVIDVPRSAFFPQPDVDSTGLRLVARANPAVAIDEERVLFRLIQVAFAHRRQSLMKCVSDYSEGFVDRPEMAHILHHVGMSATIRGEALSLEQFALLSNELSRRKHHFLSQSSKVKKR